MAALTHCIYYINGMVAARRAALENHFRNADFSIPGGEAKALREDQAETVTAPRAHFTGSVLCDYFFCNLGVFLSYVYVCALMSVFSKLPSRTLCSVTARQSSKQRGRCRTIQSFTCLLSS